MLKGIMKNLVQKYDAERAKRDEIETAIRANRKAKMDDVNKVNSNIRCPLCGNATFYDGMYPLTYGYMDVAEPVTSMRTGNNFLPVDDEDGQPMFTSTHNVSLPLITKVCKRCGYVFQQIDFSSIYDTSFSPEYFNKHIQVGERK